MHVKTNSLSQTLACYFHQDWIEEFDNADAAIAALLKETPYEEIKASVAELDFILTSEADEETLANISTDNIGCYFAPESEGYTYRKWFEHIKDSFTAALQNET